jgi:hypothetical protein
MQPNAELVSEAISPDAGTFDARAMARGQPGLPTGFTWRGAHHTIVERIEDWKQSESSNHSRSGEKYYRKHFYRVRTNRGEIVTLYAVRHLKPGENARKRWWIYTIERAETPTESPS